MMRYLISVLILSIVAFVQAWDIEIVDPNGSYHLYTSIALDSNGYPHICYDSDDFKYTHWTGSTWESETIDTANVASTSLSIDSSNYPHISYARIVYLGGSSADVSIVYTHWSGAIWESDTLCSSISAHGGSTSLALDSLDHPHIAHFRPGPGIGGMIDYATWNGSSWESEVVDSITFCNPSLALDSDDHPHIAYIDNSGKLIYAQSEGSNWTIDTVWSDTNCGDLSLVLDSADKPHISFWRYFNADLYYAYSNGSTWEIEVVDTTGYTGQYNALALDSSDHPHISYYQKLPQDELRYAHWNGSSWQVETVQQGGDLGAFTSLALDTEDHPHISYRGSSGYPLMYAYTDELSVGSNLLLERPGIIVAPNPFCDATAISFDIANSGQVSLQVFDLTGRLIEIIEDGLFDEGEHMVVFEANDLSDGVYLIRLTTETATCTERCVLIR